MTRIERGTRGRWIVALDSEDLAEARAVADEWKAIYRQRNSVQPEDCLLGVIGEVALSRFFGVEPEFVVGDSDGHCDLWLGKVRVDLKTVPWRYLDRPLLMVKRSIAEGAEHADRYVLAVCEPEHGWVSLVGSISHERFAEVKVVKGYHGNEQIWETDEDALAPLKGPKPAPPRIPKDTGDYAKRADDPRDLRVPPSIDEADYERCRALARYIGVTGGVQVRGRRGTLINAQSSLPGTPPGCRVRFLDEPEILRKSETRKNPRGEQVTRDFRSEEVEPYA